MAILWFKGMGCLFKRILSWPDCIFSEKKCFYIFLFIPSLWVLLYKWSFFRRGRRGFISRERMPIHMSHRELLFIVLKFFIRTCHGTAGRPLWQPRSAEGDLTSSCPAWRPVDVHSHLPVENCSFASVLRNKCEPEGLFQRSTWFISAMSPAGWAPQPSDSVGLCQSSH